MSRTRQCDAGCALNVIIEAAVRAPILLQQLKGVVIGKVLILHQGVRLPLLEGRHEPFNNFPVVSADKPSLPETLHGHGMRCDSGKTHGL